MLESHLKFLTIATHLIYKILALLETIVWNKILFKFEDDIQLFWVGFFSFQITLNIQYK